ncbi:hypothetical protein JD969_11480 [Planctomycetota bacterium]|nr:hypothetical protein JD969_11480 [Planctomycetota bacterium]
MIATLGVTVKTMFLENPWPLVAAMCVCGFAFLVMGGRQGNKRYLSTGITAFVLSIIVILLSIFITTDRETVLADTEKLVAATSPLEMNKVDAYIEPFAVLYGPGGGAWLDYAQIQKILPSVVGRHGIKEQTIRQLNARVLNETRIESWFGLSTKIGEGFPVRTDWRLVWDKRPDGTWRVIEIEWTKFQGKTPTEGLWNQ